MRLAGSQPVMVEGLGSGPRRRQLLAAGVLVAGLVLFAALGGLGYALSGLKGEAAAAGGSLEAAVRSPAREGPPPLGPGWRQTAEHAVIFYGGYFCASGPEGRKVRLVLSLRELDTLTQGSSRVVGPSLSMAQARGTC